MSASRETIYAALWNLISDNLNMRSEYVTMSRSIIPIADMSMDAMPALFMVQHGEDWVRPGKGIPPKRTLHCSLVIYAWTPGQRQILPSTLLNGAMDVLDNLMEKTNPQTLGGLVEHAYIEGTVQIVEAQIGSGENGSILVAPIAILIP